MHTPTVGDSQHSATSMRLAPRLTVIATARRGLVGADLAEVSVGGLEPDAAIGLFLERAARGLDWRDSPGTCGC